MLKRGHYRKCCHRHQIPLQRYKKINLISCLPQEVQTKWAKSGISLSFLNYLGCWRGTFLFELIKTAPFIYFNQIVEPSLFFSITRNWGISCFLDFQTRLFSSESSTQLAFLFWSLFHKFLLPTLFFHLAFPLNVFSNFKEACVGAQSGLGNRLRAGRCG